MSAEAIAISHTTTIVRLIISQVVQASSSEYCVDKSFLIALTPLCDPAQAVRASFAVDTPDFVDSHTFDSTFYQMALYKYFFVWTHVFQHSEISVLVDVPIYA